MKAIILSTEFVKEYDTKFGTMYLHKVKYNDKEAFYSSKSKDQKKFIPNQEAEFTETEKEGKNGKFINIKPITSSQFSNFGRSLKREQSKYSGFAMSYAKDLVVAGIIKLEEMPKYTESMFNKMVELDKRLEQ